MGFAEDVYRLSSQVNTRKEQCKGNEELTKHSLILPFFQVLGYDIHDPSVLWPEYPAGFANTKEKIDYALFVDGKAALYVEAKAVAVDLSNHDAQLAKYFNSTPGVKLAILTNGQRYKFFTDSHNANLMDNDPFFEFEISAIRAEEIEILKGFRAESFDPAGIITQAENLRYLRDLKKKFRAIFRDPSEDFIRFMCTGVFPKKITERALERLTPLLQQAMSDVLVDMVSQGLSQEIAKSEEASAIVPPTVDASASAIVAKPLDPKPAVFTTEEELAGFEAVRRAITLTCGEDPRVGYKDTASYFVIHVDKPSRWFIRLHFGADKKAVAFRMPLAQANALLGLADRIEPYGQAQDCCRVVINDLEEIQALAPLITAAYRGVTTEVMV